VVREFLKLRRREQVVGPRALNVRDTEYYECPETAPTVRLVRGVTTASALQLANLRRYF